MKNSFFKRFCALLLVMLMVLTSVPAEAFAQQITLNDDVSAVTDEQLSQLSESQSDGVNVASAEQLEQALLNKAQKICITADFELDRTFYIDSTLHLDSALNLLDLSFCPLG